MTTHMLQALDCSANEALPHRTHHIIKTFPRKYFLLVVAESEINFTSSKLFIAFILT